MWGGAIRPTIVCIWRYGRPDDGSRRNGVNTMITETKVREIHEANELNKYQHSELVAADNWIKAYALQKLRTKLSALESKSIRDFVLLMARCHYGSTETDDFLQKLDCYPTWMAHP
jgi:hypothetical protein